MKKLIASMLILALLFTLCACKTDAPEAPATAAGETQATGDTENVGSADGVSPGETPVAPAPEETPEQPLDDAAKAALSTLLTDIFTNYHLGTAGSSLVSAKYAGMLLDWRAEANAGASAIALETADFYTTLDEQGASEFAEQLGGLYSASLELLGENASDLLDTAGYTPAHYPYSMEDMGELFSGLYEGAGLLMPQ